MDISKATVPVTAAIAVAMGGWAVYERMATKVWVVESRAPVQLAIEANTDALKRETARGLASDLSSIYLGACDRALRPSERAVVDRLLDDFRQLRGHDYLPPDCPPAGSVPGVCPVGPDHFRMAALAAFLQTQSNSLP